MCKLECSHILYWCKNGRMGIFSKLCVKIFLLLLLREILELQDWWWCSQWSKGWLEVPVIPAVCVRVTLIPDPKEQTLHNNKTCQHKYPALLFRTSVLATCLGMEAGNLLQYVWKQWNVFWNLRLVWKGPSMAFMPKVCVRRSAYSLEGIERNKSRLEECWTNIVYPC